MLAEHGINVEALGGDVQSVNISALKGTNIDELMDAVLAQAEIMSLKGDPTGLVEGVVIEASTDVHRGKLATALIQRGTLKKGDVLGSVSIYINTLRSKDMHHFRNKFLKHKLLFSLWISMG